MSNKPDTEKPKDDETRRSPPLKVRRDFLRLAILTGTLGILGRRAGAFLINDVQEGELKDPLTPTQPETVLTSRCDGYDPCVPCAPGNCAQQCSSNCSCATCSCGCQCGCNCACTYNCDCSNCAAVDCSCTCQCQCECPCSCNCYPGCVTGGLASAWAAISQSDYTEPSQGPASGAMVPTRDSIFAGDDARQQQASMESMLKNTADGQNASETEGAATHTNDGTLDSGHESTASSAQSSLTNSVSASNAAATEETKRQQNQNQLDVNHWLTEYYKPPPEGFASMAESKIDVS